MILVKVAQLAGFGDARIPGYNDGNWFIAESFSFGVEREMAESGEKGGTEDINIGVGELQECTVSKSLDRSSPLLAQHAINGNSLGVAEIQFVTDGRRPICYLAYKLDRVFVKSWSTSADADDRPGEQVAFYFNRIAFVAGGQPTAMAWDAVTNAVWTAHGLPELPPIPDSRRD